MIPNVARTASGKKQRHDDRGAQIAEEQHEQHDDQGDGFEQNFLHGPDGFFDEFAAVVENLDTRAFRQARRQARRAVPSRPPRQSARRRRADRAPAPKPPRLRHCA